MNGFVSGRATCLAVAAAMTIAWCVVAALLGRPVTDAWPVGLIGLLVLSAAVWSGPGSGRLLAPAPARRRAAGTRATAKTS